jgi:hypothetical protein
LSEDFAKQLLTKKRSPTRISPSQILSRGIMMNEETLIQFTFGLEATDLEDEEKLKFAKKLLSELRNLDEVERANRTEDINPEAGSKPGLATLVGVLTAEVSFKNLQAFLGFLGDRLQDKQIKIKVKVGEQEVEIEAKSQKELAIAEETVMRLQAAMERGNNA